MSPWLAAVTLVVWGVAQLTWQPSHDVPGHRIPAPLARPRGPRPRAGPLPRPTLGRSAPSHMRIRFPTQRVYGPTATPALRLVTCGGRFDRVRRSYGDNVIVDSLVAPTAPPRLTRFDS